jgi:hypothetical protein
MERAVILQEIAKERAYQEEKWGNTTDDTVNTPVDFTAYIANYSSKWFPGGFIPYDSKTVDAFRTSMLKTAALAVAAIESVDRQRGDGGSAFYEAA